MVIEHLLLRGGAVHHGLGKAELTVELGRQILDLLKHVIVQTPIELGDLLGTVGVRNAIGGILELILQLLTAEFGLSLLLLRADLVRELDDKIEFAGRGLVVNGIELIELSDQTLQGRVRLVHHLIERVLDDRHLALRHDDLFALTGVRSIIIDRKFNGPRIPFNNTTDAHGLNIERIRIHRIHRGVNRHHGRGPVIAHGHHDVHDEITA